jgi:hypothetical protein
MRMSITEHGHTALFVAVGVTLCSGCGSPPSIDSAFVDHLPRQYNVEEICASDVGPGLASAEVVAELVGLAAGEITSANSFPDDDEGLKALVSTAKSGNGDAFVDAFLSRVGEARNDTVTLGEHIVRYFKTPLARATPTPRGRPLLSATSRRRVRIGLSRRRV